MALYRINKTTWIDPKEIVRVQIKTYDKNEFARKTDFSNDFDVDLYERHPVQMVQYVEVEVRGQGDRQIRIHSAEVEEGLTVEEMAEKLAKMCNGTWAIEQWLKKSQGDQEDPRDEAAGD